MSWTRWTHDAVREFVTACTGPDWPGRPKQAEALLERLREDDGGPARRGRPEPRPRMGVDKSRLPFAPPSRPDRDDRNAVRNDGMRVLRIRVLARAKGRCEFRCALAGEPTDAHHIFGGADRRELESEYTLAGVCEECHGKCNASPAWARAQALAFARRMAAAAQAAGDSAGVAGFTATAELLEARIALAGAQASTLPRGTP